MWKCANEERGALTKTSRNGCRSHQRRDNLRFQLYGTSDVKNSNKFGVHVDDRLKCGGRPSTIPSADNPRDASGRRTLGGPEQHRPHNTGNDACVNPDLVNGLLTLERYLRGKRIFLLPTLS
jgi:hypothetical protein